SQTISGSLASPGEHWRRARLATKVSLSDASPDFEAQPRKWPWSYPNLNFITYTS
ncbi:hypothetical protein A2U01_0071949, partial [Trifolium medium]|nr:hypothetical protein [Trifolium medium]